MTMTWTSWAGPVRRAFVAIVLVATVSLGLSACHHLSPPVGLGPCYESLPLAEGALDVPKASYVFHGVELVSPKILARLVKRRFPKNPSADYNPPAGTNVCAFAFTGSFPAGQVAGAPSGVSGKAAIVLTTTDRKLLFSFVLAKLPVNFSRPFTGA
jgi:hypothetical protein